MNAEFSCFKNYAERMEAFRSATLYPVISSEFCAGRDPFDIFCAMADGGAKLVQIREKNMSARDCFELVARCRAKANRRRILLIVNDRLDIALAAHADGVHLGQDDLPTVRARAVAPDLIVGTSTHNRDEIAHACADCASYLNIGPVFHTQTKTLPMQPLGMEVLAELIPLASVPFTVMGGIKEADIPSLVALGARRIAVVTALTQSADPAAETRRLTALIDASVSRT